MKRAWGSVGKEGRACIDRVSRRNLIPPRPFGRPAKFLRIRLPNLHCVVDEGGWGEVLFRASLGDTQPPRLIPKMYSARQRLDPADRKGISSLYFSRYGGSAALIDGTVVLLE